MALAMLLCAEVFGFYLLLAGRVGGPALLAAAMALVISAFGAMLMRARTGRAAQRHAPARQAYAAASASRRSNRLRW